jgi:hypothetical protein
MQYGKKGDVVKLVDTLALGASGAILESSSLSIPTLRKFLIKDTFFKINIIFLNYF